MAIFLTVPGVHRRPLALIAERDPDTRQMYADFLRLSACEVDEAEDGREALAKALARHHDVIVTDTRLPGISGIDLCRLLRQERATRDTPILFVTGDAYPSDVRRAEEAGADAVLIKPCLPQQLANMIRRVLSRSREPGVPSRTISGRRSNDPRRNMFSRAHDRHDTVHPPIALPAPVCPACGRPLAYTKSHVGGASARHPEQWDYFECSAGCGTFEYRQRTRKLRRVS